MNIDNTLDALQNHCGIFGTSSIKQLSPPNGEIGFLTFPSCQLLFLLSILVISSFVLDSI